MRALKDAVKTALPDSAVERFQRVLARRARERQTRTRPIDLTRIELIRRASLVDLRDPAYLEEHLLPSLGLNDEMLHQIPPSLHEYAGYGLLHWQLPNQFSNYLVELSRHEIESYLEIGARHGGTFVITVEYLDRFHPIRRAVAVDLGRSRSLERYASMREGVSVMQANSHSEEFQAMLRDHGHFDLALIDGDHSEDGCRADFEQVEDRAGIIVLHDIASSSVPGVERVWREINDTRADAFRFLEFAEPHPGKVDGVVDFGLGVAIRR